MENVVREIIGAMGVKLLDIENRVLGVTPKDFVLHDLERFEDEPRRIRAKAKFTRLTDFADYVNRFKKPATTIFINPAVESLGGGAPIATAKIDFHGQSAHTDVGIIDDAAPSKLAVYSVGAQEPSRCTHDALYVASMSPAFELLASLDGKLLAQDEFAQRLRDLLRFCREPTGGELLEVIRTLVLTSKGDYQSHHDDVSGSLRLKYDVQVDARAGTSERALTVPSTIKFILPVLLGSNETEITTELIYRAPQQSGGKVQLGLRIPERKWLEHGVIESIAVVCKDLTGCMTLVGSVE